jgi:UDP-glucose:(heptosyl)LPS alpha-1,3-glucosyltransferase
MNVALVIERIEPWRGGAETSTVQFAHHLADQGCRVTVLTMTNMPSTPAMTIVPIRASAGWRAGRTWFFSRGAADYIRSHPFDVVHAMTPCLAADVYEPRGGTVPEMLERNLALRPSPVRRGFKWVGQRLSLKYRVLGGLERRLVTRQPTPWVIAISRYVAAQLERHYRFDPARIRLIFNGVDPDDSTLQERQMHRVEVRRQFGLADDDLVLLAVAHNFKLKGVDRLIQAMAHPQVRQLGHVYAVIVGRDNPRPLARLAAHHGLADHVFFAGPSQRVNAFFHAADVLVHPTYYDPCSRVVLESMSAGLPVITTKYNGASECVTDGHDGYVLDCPSDVEALADRIIRLAAPAHRRRCAEAAPAAVESFTMARHAAEVVRLYEEILRNREVRRVGA